MWRCGGWEEALQAPHLDLPLRTNAKTLPENVARPHQVPLLCHALHDFTSATQARHKGWGVWLLCVCRCFRPCTFQNTTILEVTNPLERLPKEMELTEFHFLGLTSEEPIKLNVVVVTDLIGCSQLYVARYSASLH